MDSFADTKRRRRRSSARSGGSHRGVNCQHSMRGGNVFKGLILRFSSRSAGGFAVAIAACDAAASDASAPPFSEVRAIFAAKCLACHGTDRRN